MDGDDNENSMPEEIEEVREKMDFEKLSHQELKLLGDYITNHHELYTTSVAEELTTGKLGSNNSFGAGIADVLHYLSDSVTNTDRQILRLDDMRRSLEQFSYESPSAVDLPDEATITPDQLHWLASRFELTAFYSHVGVLIEKLTVELMIEEIVDQERRSKRVRKRIEERSWQAERLWWLFVTGVLSSGEKGTIQETYARRNDLVHGSLSVDDMKDINFEKEINDAWEAVNLLHEKLYGIRMEHRISETLLGNEGF
jgi:hypothetical protein